MASTIGRDFVFGFVNNWIGTGIVLSAHVSNANDQPTSVTVTSRYAKFQTINVIVQPNTIEIVMNI